VWKRDRNRQEKIEGVQETRKQTKEKESSDRAKESERERKREKEGVCMYMCV
jgi:hypothetical protein